MLRKQLEMKDEQIAMLLKTVDRLTNTVAKLTAAGKHQSVGPG